MVEEDGRRWITSSSSSLDRNTIMFKCLLCLPLLSLLDLDQFPRLDRVGLCLKHAIERLMVSELDLQLSLSS